MSASPWGRVLLLYLCGLLAAAQLGKLSALAPLVQADLVLSLTVVAAAMSLIELGGSTLGGVAGVMAWRLGLPRTLRLGVTALALGGLGGAWAHGAAGLVGWRLLEAAGYLAVIVSAPVLIARHTAAAGERTQALALTLWSTFVPVGLALGAGLGAALAGPWGWRGAVVSIAGLGLLLCAVVWRAPLPDPAAHEPTGRHVTVSRATWCLAQGFGGFALFEIGLLGLLPTLLVREAGLTPAVAGHWTAAASLSAVIGSVAAAWLLRHGLPLRGAVMLSVGVPPLLLFGVFRAQPPAALAVTLALAINMLGGIFASLAFAVLPRLARTPGELVRANGLIAQCGASGSLLGPPAMAACVQWGGWTAAAVFGAAVSVIALPLVWRALAASAEGAVAQGLDGVADQVP